MRPPPLPHSAQRGSFPSVPLPLVTAGTCPRATAITTRRFAQSSTMTRDKRRAIRMAMARARRPRATLAACPSASICEHRRSGATRAAAHDAQLANTMRPAPTGSTSALSGSLSTASPLQIGTLMRCVVVRANAWRLRAHGDFSNHPFLSHSTCSGRQAWATRSCRGSTSVRALLQCACVPVVCLHPRSLPRR